MESFDDIVVNLKNTWFIQRSQKMVLEVDASERLYVGEGPYFQWN